MRGNGADRGILPTRKQGKILPRIHDRAAKPKCTEAGDIEAFAVLANKNHPPAEWDISMPSHDPMKRWYWLFLILGLALFIAPAVLR